MSRTRKTERLIHLAGEILRREQEIARLRREFFLLANGPDPAGWQPVRPRGSGLLPAPRMVRGLKKLAYEAMPADGSPIAAGDLARTLGIPKEQIPTFHTTLSKLVAEGRLERCGWGVYCLPHGEPGTPAETATELHAPGRGAGPAAPGPLPDAQGDARDPGHRAGPLPGGGGDAPEHADVPPPLPGRSPAEAPGPPAADAEREQHARRP